MNLTTKGRYAVMAMADMALQNTTNPITLSDISARQGITINYLEQIFIRLRRAGLVNSVRGPGGGYVFTKEAPQIKIAEIISAVDEPIKMTKCSKENGTASCVHHTAKCVAHGLWQGLTDHIHSYLESVSLDDLCHNRIKNKAKSFEIFKEFANG